MSDADPTQQPPDNDSESKAAPASKTAGLGVLAVMCLAAEGVLYPIAEHAPMPIRVLAHGSILGGYALVAYATAFD